MDLLLIRHGPSQVDRTLPASQWTLTVAGEATCARFALDRLPPYQPTRFITSHEPKAWRTGQIMASALGGLPCTAAPDLHEHLREHVPWFDSVSEFQAAVMRLFSEPDRVVFGEESANQTRRRLHHAVTSLVSRYPDEALAIVTHGTALSLFVAHYNEINVAAYWQRLTMPACTILSLPSYQLTETLYAPEIDKGCVSNPLVMASGQSAPNCRRTSSTAGNGSCHSQSTCNQNPGSRGVW